MREHFGCPVQATANAIAGKWKVQIVWHLAYGPRRFGELRRLLPGVSEKVLTAQLREMEAESILRREIIETPPQVTYSLSLAGEELLPALNLLCGWGTRHLGVPSRLPPLPSSRTSPLLIPHPTALEQYRPPAVFGELVNGASRQRGLSSVHVDTFRVRH